MAQQTSEHTDFLATSPDEIVFIKKKNTTTKLFDVTRFIKEREN